MILSYDEFRQRCRGAILGTAFGDALGLPVEGLDAESIRRRFGRFDTYLPHPDGTGRTSDDTQLTLATGLSLVRSQGVDAADCAASCAALFDRQRGYGRSAERVLGALQQGGDYRQTGRLMFSEGSFGNGAAMRIAPVGLMYGHLPWQRLQPIVSAAVRATHIHPEAIEAASLLARLSGRLSRQETTVPVDAPAFFEEGARDCSETPLLHKLSLARQLLADKADDRSAAVAIGSGVRSSESVVLALFLALRYLDQPTAAVVAAVQCGGDADTVAAMTGAVLGARHGDRSFPVAWHDQLERGENGYEALRQMADDLAATIVKTRVER